MFRYTRSSHKPAVAGELRCARPIVIFSGGCCTRTKVGYCGSKFCYEAHSCHLMFRRLILFTSVISSVVFFGLLFFVNPSNAGPLGILALFLSAYFSLWGVLSFLVYGIVMVVNKFRTDNLRHNYKQYRFLSAYYVASIVALFPVVLVAIQTVRQITMLHLFILGIFFVIAVGYVFMRLK